MFLGHAIVGLDPTDNFLHLLRSIPAEIDDENAIIRKKMRVSVKSFFHPGSGNVVNGFPEADDVILFSGHIGPNIGLYVLVLAGAAILRAALSGLPHGYLGNIHPGVIAIASSV